MQKLSASLGCCWAQRGLICSGAADVKTMALGEDDQHVTKCHGLNSLVEEVTDALTAQLSHRTADACEGISLLFPGRHKCSGGGVRNHCCVHGLHMAEREKVALCSLG